MGSAILWQSSLLSLYVNDYVVSKVTIMNRTIEKTVPPMKAFKVTTAHIQRMRERPLQSVWNYSANIISICGINCFGSLRMISGKSQYSVYLPGYLTGYNNPANPCYAQYKTLLSI